MRIRIEDPCEDQGKLCRMQETQFPCVIIGRLVDDLLKTDIVSCTETGESL